MSEMRSEVIVLFVSALAIVLIVIGISGLINTDSSSYTDGFVNSTVEVPSEWNKVDSPDNKIIVYNYNSTFWLNIEIINKSTYCETFDNAQEIQNNNMGVVIIDIEGVDVLYEKNIVFDNTNDLKKVKNLIQQYVFQKEGKYYVVRFSFFPKNSTDNSIINSSSALFNETIKSIIRTI